VLLTQALRGLGVSRKKAQPYIPDRIDEGYGLNFEALTHIREEIKADLVITVDCGVRSVAEVQHANDIGLDLIITDHHSLGATLPPAFAIINPKRPENKYPEDMLAGVGIAFKLAQALKLALPHRANFHDDDLLDLVAIGTVADLAPLKNENRMLVIDGLRVMNDSNRLRPGIWALTQIAGVKGEITAETIGFGLGPRINAAGRLAHAYDAAKLLAVNNELQARQYASALDELNKKRQKLTRDLGNHAEDLIDPTASVFVVADESFAPGVVGLVASRLAEKYYRPAIVIEKGETHSHGSCRSISEVHITEALDDVADLLDRYGGHAQAAGLTIANENLPEFEERITKNITAQIEGLDLRPTIPVDAEIPLRHVDWALHGVLQNLEPTGYANATPIFVSRNVQVISFRAVGSDSSHLQIEVSDGAHGVKGIAFRQGAWVADLPRMVDIAYTIGINEWNGRRNLQLMVKDIRETGT
jgi:single-stranded-DNA-specific exonuclease